MDELDAKLDKFEEVSQATLGRVGVLICELDKLPPQSGEMSTVLNRMKINARDVLEIERKRIAAYRQLWSDFKLVKALRKGARML